MVVRIPRDRHLRDSYLINLAIVGFGSGHCQDLAPKYREAAAILSTADLPRPVVLAKYDDSTDSQRRLRAGAEDGRAN